jgi:hypothetical protein
LGGRRIKQQEVGLLYNNELIMRENIEKEHAINSRYIIIFYLLSFGIAWIFWVPMALNHLELIHFKIPLIIGQSIGAFAPLFSVYLLSRMLKNRQLFTSFFESVKKTKKQIPLAILSAMFAVIIAIIVSFSVWISDNDSGLNIIKSNYTDKYGAAVIAIMFIQFITAFIGSPLGEEIGWRGFALTNIKHKTGRLLASSIVGILWWTWHVPLFIVLGVPVTFYSCLEFVGYSFIIDTLFLYSQNNLLIAMLCHQGLNTKFTFFAGRTSNMPGLLILWAICILIFLAFEFYLKKRIPRSRAIVSRGLTLPRQR